MHARMRLVTVRDHTLCVCVASGRQTMSRGGTDRRLVVTVLESHGSLRQPIEVGRPGKRIPKTAQSIKAMVIAHQYQDVHSRLTSIVVIGNASSPIDCLSLEGERIFRNGTLKKRVQCFPSRSISIAM